jgi:hypothetical protein
MRSGQRQTVVSLPPDVLVCLHTDGLNEARTPGGRLGEERVERLLESCNTDVLSAVALLDAVAAAADTSGDDMAAVLLRAELSAATTCETLTEDLEVAVDSDLAIVEQFVAAGGLSDSEVARAVAEVAAARGPGRPVLLRILSRTHTFEVQAAVFAESHIGPRCSPKPADS